MVCGLVLLRRDVYARLERHTGTLIWLSAAGVFALFVALDVSTAELGSPLNRTLAFGVALLSSTLILSLAFGRSPTHPVARVLGSRVMVYLGSISYPFFLIQLTEPCQWLYWILLGPVKNRILRAILLYIVSVPIAALLHALVERPARRWLDARRETP
jgi:peptidoglycan/LPS O-acetylase OafA/YrhL